MTKLRNKTFGMSIALCAAMLAGSAGADTRLQSKDGSFVLQGEILDITDENYVIQTEMGEMIVRREFVNCDGDFCPIDPANADAEKMVQLVSADGKVTLDGELLNVDDASYYIRTDRGDLTVARAFMSCEGAACPTSVVDASYLSLVGPSGTGAAILTEVVKSFAAGKGYQITESLGDGDIELLIGGASGELVSDIRVSAQSTEDALKALINGDASFVMTKKPATPEMLTKLTGRPVAAVEDVLDGKIVGLDALSVVTHPSNPLNTLSMSDVSRVLSGEITNWAQLGGADTPIALHLGAENSELESLVAASFANGSTSRAAKRHEDLAAVSAAVQADPAGFGVVYRSQSDDLRQMELSSNCSIYYGASDFAVQSNEYPFVVNLYAYSLRDGELDDTAANLMSYLNSDAGQGTLSKLGLVSQAMQIAPMKDQGARVLSSVISVPSNRSYDTTLRRYLSTVSDSTRLSTALRFVTGSSTPDDRAIQDIVRISDYVRQSANQGQKLTVVGFSDSYGEFAPNLSLSAGRAEAIKAQLLARNPGWLEADDIEVLGVGPIAPVDCNDTARGRELNRRVEIWVSPKR